MVKREKFEKKVNELSSEKGINTILLSEAKYEEIMQDLRRIETEGAKSDSDYHKKRRYQIRVVANVEKLIQRGTELEFIPQNQLYDVVNNAHLKLGHGGRNVLKKELSATYANVTTEILMAYLRLCEECQKKQAKTSKHIVVRPIISSELNSRCQVDLIDMQSQADDEFRFIMVYQDHLTKFVQLRPLRSKTAEEVAVQLLDIFCIFGAPTILQSDNGREFENSVIKELLLMWPECKLVHGKPRHSQSQGSVERANRDIQDKLKCWMSDNQTTKWSQGLRFVQFAKNRCLHSGIGRSPFKATFGAEPKVGLSTSVLPAEVVPSIVSEEQLEEALKHPQTEQKSHDKHQTVKDDEVSMCVVCGKRCSAAHKCSKCNLSCHAICGRPDDNEGYGSDVICKLCEKGESSNSERQSAKRRMELQAEKMKETFFKIYGFLKCSCLTKCTSNRCKCRANGKLCNSKCHASNCCNNK